MSQNNILRISNQSISWLLIATVLLVTLLPAHYHLHHVYENDEFSSAATLHEHVIDLHVLTEKSGQHHHDDAVTSIEASPDGIVKKSGSDYFPFILLAISLLLLFSINRQLVLSCHSARINFKQHYSYLTPLLRAPPLVQP